jgi:fumarate hydratase class I
MIGKAERGPEAIAAIREFHSVYVLAFADLGMEAIYEFDVVDMPVTVAVDSLGSSVHTTGPAEWQSRIAQHLPNTAILQ